MLYIKVQNKKNTPKSHLAFFHLVIHIVYKSTKQEEEYSQISSCFFHLVIHIVYFPPQPTADFLLYKCAVIKSVFSQLTLVVFQFFLLFQIAVAIFMCVCVCVCVCVYVNVYSHISR